MYLSSLRRVLTAAALVLAVSRPSSALAAATVTVSPSGESTYTVQGAGMDGVAGIQLDVTYDAKSLSTPTVNKGDVAAGALLAANSSLPGLIKIAIISTSAFSASGQIASISFASKTGSGGIQSVTAAMYDSSGAALPVIAAIAGGTTGSTGGLSSTPAVPFTQTTQTTQTDQTTRTGQSGQTDRSGSTPAVTYTGTVTLPPGQQQAESQPPPPAPAPAVTAEPSPPGGADRPLHPDRPSTEAQPAETLQYVAYRGVLERFRLFSGKKSLPALTELFDRKVSHIIRQEPALPFSDGKSRVTLTIDVPARITATPVFKADGAELLSSSKDPRIKGRWNAELLPDAGVVKATFTITAGAEEFEYPLTVAPKLKTALTLDEAGWARFVAETGTKAAPLHDFNGDGVRDYIDEYIFVFNSLAGKAK